MPEQENDVVYFGASDFRGANRLFGIKRSDRRQHMYVIGKSGTGKTALLQNMIVQDIANGEGLCVVDPHGELVEALLKKIPEHRKEDVVYFNPADPDYHIGFNVLELPDKRYKHLVASGLMGIFTKIWAGVWSARMEYIMNNAILALLDTPNTTLLGITRMLVDKDYRQQIVANVTDPVIRAFWINEFEQWKDQFRNEAIAPIQNKVGQFLSTALIRNIIGQEKSTIDIFNLMNDGKILLVNVSKGRIGEDNSALLGSMLITKMQLAAMERVRVAEEDRVDFYLYIDEFQNFSTDSFANILSEARKYRLDLILAHQYIGQLVTGGSGTTGVSTKVRDAVFGNAGTLVVFRVGATDAEFLENEFEPEFTIQDIVNLPNYKIYLKLMVNGISSRPFSAATLAPFKLSQTKCLTEEEVIQISRKKYTRPRYIVEEEISNWSSVMGGQGAGGHSGERRGNPSHDTGGAVSAPHPEVSAVGAPTVMPRKKEENPKYFSALAGVGIEFPMESAQAAQEKPRERPMPQPQVKQEAPRYTERRREAPIQQNTNRDNYSARPETKIPDSSKPPQGRRQEEKKDEKPAMSLKDLRPRDETPKPKHHPREGVNISVLKSAISDALDSYLDPKKSDSDGSSPLKR
jgi:Type IV secretion-system coupling protein DNA-binding domain